MKRPGNPWEVARQILMARTGAGASDLEVSNYIQNHADEFEDLHEIPGAGASQWLPEHLRETINRTKDYPSKGLELEKPPAPKPSPSEKSYRFDGEWEKLPNGDYKLHKKNERYE